MNCDSASCWQFWFVSLGVSRMASHKETRWWNSACKWPDCADVQCTSSFVNEGRNHTNTEYRLLDIPWENVLTWGMCIMWEYLSNPTSFISYLSLISVTGHVSICMCWITQGVLSKNNTYGVVLKQGACEKFSIWGTSSCNTPFLFS